MYGSHDRNEKTTSKQAAFHKNLRGKQLVEQFSDFSTCEDVYIFFYTQQISGVNTPRGTGASLQCSL
jgi:hypothetical protein